MRWLNPAALGNGAVTSPFHAGRLDAPCLSRIVGPHVDMMKASQELLLDLIESEGAWNAFDGAKIAAALRDNRTLWRAVVLTDGGYEYLQNETGEVTGVGPELSALGGLLEDNLLYDVIRAVPKAGKHRELEALFESMGPDAVRWLMLDQAAGAFGRTTREEFVAYGYSPEHAILEAWWD